MPVDMIVNKVFNVEEWSIAGFESEMWYSIRTFAE